MRIEWGLIALLAFVVATTSSAPCLAAGDEAMTRHAPDQPAAREQTPVIVVHPDLFTDDDLLLFEMDVGGDQLTDSFGAYSSRAGVFLPLGALARLLDLAITVDAARGHAEGWVITQGRTVRLDMASRRLEIGDKVIPLSIADAAIQGDDIYLRADLIEKIAPVRLKVDTHGLVIAITPTEQLPFQQREERERRRGQLGSQNGGEAVLNVPAPYALFSPPAVELTLATSAGNHGAHVTGSYDVRAAGDLAYADGQFYAGSDDAGRLTNLRMLLERKDPNGHAAGPLGLTRLDLGDTFTPQLSLGARSGGGRGVFITSEPLEQADVFNKVDLRGELPVGYEVELYIGEILRGAQSQAIDGRYQFLGVNLAYGLNVVRLVFYGPHGERREEVRRINVGAGQLDKNQTTFRFGLVQQDVPSIDVLRQPLITGLTGTGDMRLVAELAHGLTNTTTVTAGFARYSPSINNARDLGVLGVTTSIDGFAAKLNLGVDDRAARDLSLGVAGQRMGVSLVARHSEYAGDFRDELISTSVEGGPALRRDTRLDLNYSPNAASIILPLQATFERTERADGSVIWLGSADTSRPVGRFLVSSSLNYNATLGGAAASPPQLGGAFAVSGLVDGLWEVRGAAAYSVRPQARLDNLAISADRQLADRLALHFGVAHQFGPGAGTQLQMADTWRFDAADLSLTTSYSTANHDFRIGLQVTLGFGYDPIARRYRSMGPGIASGGAMAIETFRDTSGDGVKQASEAGIAGITADGGRRKAVSGPQGELLVTGLGDGTSARVRLGLDALDDPYLSGPPTTLVTTPRPGHIAKVSYPMINSGEVELKISFERAGEPPQGLSALIVQLQDAKGRVAGQGRTEYDGTLLLEGLKPGAYTLRIEPEEAQRLRMMLKAPVTVVVPPGGGFVGSTSATVVLVGTNAVPKPPPQAAGATSGSKIACCVPTGADASRNATGEPPSIKRSPAQTKGGRSDVGFDKHTVHGHGRRVRRPAEHLHGRPAGASAASTRTASDRAAAGAERAAVDRAAAWGGAHGGRHAQTERAAAEGCGRPVAGPAADRAPCPGGGLRHRGGERLEQPSAVFFAGGPGGAVRPVAVGGRDRAGSAARPARGGHRPGARGAGRDGPRSDQEPHAQDGAVQPEAAGRRADAGGRGPGLIAAANSARFGI